MTPVNCFGGSHLFWQRATFHPRYFLYKARWTAEVRSSTGGGIGLCVYRYMHQAPCKFVAVPACLIGGTDDAHAPVLPE